MHLIHLAPDASIFLLTLGLLLIYLELNRPGLILPGAAGLLLALLGTASILRLPPSPRSLIVLGAAVLILLLDLLRPTPILLSLAATLALIFGFLHLTSALPSGPNRTAVHPATAVACGLVLGAGTSLLTRLARRARRNKGLDLKPARTSRPGVSPS